MCSCRRERKRGRKHGYGKETIHSHSTGRVYVYEGEFVNNQWHGATSPSLPFTQTCNRTDIRSHRRALSHPVRPLTGVGTQYVNGRIVYQGDFRECVRHGHGILFDPTMDEPRYAYCGQWTNGQFHGSGTVYSRVNCADEIREVRGARRSVPSTPYGV